MDVENFEWSYDIYFFRFLILFNKMAELQKHINLDIVVMPWILFLKSDYKKVCLVCVVSDYYIWYLYLNQEQL